MPTPRKLPHERIKQKRITLDVKVKFKRDENVTKTINALQDLTKDGAYGLEVVLRQAIRDSLYKLYAARWDMMRDQKRFLLKTGEGDTNRVSKQKALKKLIRYQGLRRAALEKVREARAAGNTAKVKQYTDAANFHVEGEQRAMYEFTGVRYSKDSFTTRRAAPNAEGTSEEDSRRKIWGSDFRGRMHEVFTKLMPKYPVKAQARRRSLTLGFGSIAALDRGPQTSLFSDSKFNLLWRQLEFGTGIWSKAQPKIGAYRALTAPRPRVEGDTKSEDGSWFYNQVHVLGSRPGNFLRDETGLVFPADSSLFRTAFQQALSSALRGH